MTALDWGVAGFLGVAALIGLWRGAVKQLVALASWAAALLAPWMFAGVLARVLEKPLEVAYPIALLFSAGALALVAWVVTRLVVGFVLKRLIRPAGEDGEGGLLPPSVDRLLGGIVSTARMGVVAWVLLSVLALITAALENRGTKTGLEKSAFIQLCQQHNAVGLALSGRLEGVSQALQKQKAKRAPEAEKAMRDLAKDDRFRRVGNDPKLREALQSGDVLAIARSPDLLSLVNDPRAMEQVRAVVSGAAGQIEGATR